MKKVVLVPDSFKGTLSAREICEIMREQLQRHYPAAEICSIPVADGGEGSVDCFLTALPGEKVLCATKDPFGQEMQGFYGRIDGGKTAVIEMAACAGLPLVEDRCNPLLASTYGVGMLIANALERHAEKIVLGLGGSATNDGGCGTAAALGALFFKADGTSFVPTGGTLSEIAHIDLSRLDKRLQAVEIVAMCDIDNPMYGKNGAAYVFGPQKGATPDMLPVLDNGLRHLDKIIQAVLHKDVSKIPGGGAAGAMGAGVAAFFGAKLKRGIDVVLDTVQFETILQHADMVLTGEGKIDAQSLGGKVVIGVAQRAFQHHVPVIAVVGDIEDPIEAAYEAGISSIISINRRAIPFSESRHKAREYMARTMDDLARQLKAFGI